MHNYYSTFAIRFKPGGWLHFLRQQGALISALHAITERGLQLIKSKDPAVKERLLEAHDLFSFIEKILPEISRRWARDRAARGK